MSSLNNEDQEAYSERSKVISNPSRGCGERRSKENSLELRRWHSFKDELIKERKDHSYSYQRVRASAEHSEQKMNSLILVDRSNSELKTSVASKYIDYLDHFKKTYGDILRKNDGEEMTKDREFFRSKMGHKDANILLNSTILSNCFNDRSFHEPIQENSNEADFIEEDDSRSANNSFFAGHPREGFSKVFNNLERESFSFDNKAAFSGLLEEIQRDNMPQKFRMEESFDTLDNVNQLDLKYFFERDPYKDLLGLKPIVSNYNPEEEYIRMTIIHLSLGDNKFSDEYIISSRGLVNSRKNTKPKAVVIGRMSTVIEDVRPNDVILPFSDKSISRVHCALEYKYKFSQRNIPMPFVAFLSGKNPKIAGHQCALRRLTKDLLMRIYSFLKPPSRLYALDLGSSTGTYKRVLYNKQVELTTGSIFMVGNSFQFTINHVSSSHTSSTNLDLLYQLLAEEPEEKTEICGLTSEQMRKVEFFREKKKCVINEILKEGENDSFLKEQNPAVEVSFPLLILEFENAPSSMKSIK